MSSRMLASMMCLLGLVVVLEVACWGATNAREVEEDNSLASELVTPHKDWARGYAGGPVRALFFVYTGAYDGTWEDTGTRVREVVELCQRFDVQADAVLYCGPSRGVWTFHGGELGQQRAERLLEAQYELFVIAGFPIEKLPAKIQYLILRQVTDGAGLLCCGPGSSLYFAPQRRLEPIPRLLVAGLPVLGGKSPAQMVSAYRLKKGRGVWLNYNAHALTPATTYSRRAVAEYDYWMLLVGRAALWAAGKETGVSVESVLGDQAVTVSRQGGARLGDVVLHSDLQQPLPVTASLALRRASDGLETSLGEAPATLSPGESTRVPVRLPAVRAGEYFVDVVVKSSRGVEACGAGMLTAESEYGVERVTTARRFVERGEMMRGTVQLRGTPPPQSMLRVRFRDSYDRVLKQEDFAVQPDQAEYAFEYRADEFATIEMRVEAVLLVDGQEVEQAETIFTVPKRRQGQFNFVMWDAPNDPLALYAWRQMQEAGFRVCLIGSMGGERAQPAALRAGDASLVPYSTRILDPKDERGYMQPVCWNDDPAAQEYVQGIVDNQKLLREQGVFVYSLGDEGVTLGCCVHPACLTAYRRYLAGQYGTIDKLNESWGTAYGSFDEVDLLNHADNMELAAAKTSPPRWCDRQMFARYNLMQFSRRFVEAYERLDPQALTGFEGTGGFGDDYDAILGINGFYGPYPSIGDDIIRSVAPPELVNSNWMGYSKTGDALSDAAWRMVMKGKNSIWYWMWSGIGNWRGYLRPTLDFWPAIRDLTEEMRPVRQGLGDLLMRSKVVHSGIAIHYSVPSALASQLTGDSGFLDCQAAHESWTRLTYELGLDCRYLTSGMLKQGALTTEEFRVLLLPYAQAISPEEARAIRTFVERGGTVIADVRPGIYDGHCKAVSPGLLDDLFGIQRTGAGKAMVANVPVTTSPGRRRLTLELPGARVDPQVMVAGAEALGRVGQTPILIVNRVGAGRAVLLNFQPIASGSSHPQTIAAWRLVRALYEDCGVRAPVTVTSPDGGALARSETRVWRDGEALVFGLWRQMENAWFSPTGGDIAGPPVAAQVSLPAPRHIYDLRGGRYLGELTALDTELRWGRASFFMALPYRIGRMEVRVSNQSPAPGERLRVALELRIPPRARELFVAWAEITDPLGNRPLWGRQVVLLPSGRGRLELCTAYNDVPGTWRLRATELFSGQSAEATWVVRS